MSRPPAVLAALAFAALLSPAAAQAGETHFWSTRGMGDSVIDGTVRGGYVRASVNVTFKKRSYDVKGLLEDVCEGGAGDGRGAYLSTNFPSFRAVAKDADGCGNGRVSFDPAPVVSKNPIRSVNFVLCEKDYTFASQVCSNYRFVNPYAR